jgi:hypothetical protein
VFRSETSKSIPQIVPLVKKIHTFSSKKFQAPAGA